MIVYIAKNWPLWSANTFQATMKQPLLKLELVIMGMPKIIASHKSKENGSLFVNRYLKLQALRHKFNCFTDKEILFQWKVELEAWSLMLLMFSLLKNRL